MPQEPLSAEVRWAGPFGFITFSEDGVDVASAAVTRSPSGITVNTLTVKEDNRGKQIGHSAFHMIADIFVDYLSDPVEFEWINDTLVCGNLSVIASRGFKPAVDAWASEVRERINADSRLLQERGRAPIEEYEALSGKKVETLARKDTGKDRKARS